MATEELSLAVVRPKANTPAGRSRRVRRWGDRWRNVGVAGAARREWPATTSSCPAPHDALSNKSCLVRIEQRTSSRQRRREDVREPAELGAARRRRARPRSRRGWGVVTVREPDRGPRRARCRRGSARVVQVLFGDGGGTVEELRVRSDEPAVVGHRGDAAPKPACRTQGSGLFALTTSATPPPRRCPLRVVPREPGVVECRLPTR